MPDEADWLRRFTNTCISSICEVLSPADSLQQLKDLQQRSDECMESYINWFLWLCKSAERTITTDRPFTPAKLTTVTENLTFFCAGIKNSTERDLAMSAWMQFSGHHLPNTGELKRQACNFVQLARAQLQLPGSKKHATLVGLKFRKTDSCLQEA